MPANKKLRQLSRKPNDTFSQAFDNKEDMNNLNDSSSLPECTTSLGDYNLSNSLLPSVGVELEPHRRRDTSRLVASRLATFNGHKSGHGRPRNLALRRGNPLFFGATSAAR